MQYLTTKEETMLAPISKPLVYDHEELFTVAVQKAKNLELKFVLDEPFKKIMRTLSLYFANDPEFESKGHGSLKKGLYIMGPVGSGKTLLMESFRDNPRRRYSLISINSLTDKYMKEGIEALETYFSDTPSLLGGGFCFDDLGSENESVKYMGSEANVMERIILNRYEKRLPFHYTHFTSNCDGDAIQAKYGLRVRSRLKEMCNVIKLLGTDRRF